MGLVRICHPLQEGKTQATTKITDIKTMFGNEVKWGEGKKKEGKVEEKLKWRRGEEKWGGKYYPQILPSKLGVKRKAKRRFPFPL